MTDTSGSWKQYVPSWVRVRCTDRFVGHLLFFLFVLGSYWLVSFFHVPASEVVAAALLGGALFLFTRFVLHETGTVFATGTAIVFVGVIDIVVPALLGYSRVVSWQDLLQRLPVLLSMTVVEILEDDSLEEEIESVERGSSRK